MLRVIYFILFIFFLISCQKDIDTNPSPFSSDYHVSVEDIQTIAKSFNFGKIDLKSTYSESREILEILKITENEMSLLYIVNFKDDRGFAIFTSDIRTFPLVAYATSGNFRLEDVGSGLAEWLHSQKIYVQNANNLSISEIDFNLSLWGNTDAIPSGVPNPTPDPDLPTTTIEIIEPLLNTNWGQDCGYNSQCPTASDGPCGRAYTGCVATAMAQIMKYHNFPTNYN